MKINSIKIGLKQLFFVLFIILLDKSALFAQKCNDLISYRDNTLYNEYDKAFKKYTINQQAQNDVLKIKSDLLNDTRWATSDAGLTTGLIAQNIKATCNLIANLLKFNPAIGITGTVVTRTVITADKIYRTIDAGQTISSLVIDGAEKTGYDVLLSNGGPLGKAVKTAWDLSEDISKMVSMPQDRAALKNDVKRVLDMVENESTKYNQAIANASMRMNEINQIKAGIDKYLLENCRPMVFRGNGNSNSSRYGIGGCVWNMQMQNVNITFTLNKQNNAIAGAQISNDEVETTISGRCISGTRFRDIYNQSGGSFLGNTVNINFVPVSSNHQKCNARFTGTLSGQTISGTIIWNRVDQPQAPPIQYQVTMPLTLNR